MDNINEVLAAYEPDIDDWMLAELCQYRGDPGTRFDEIVAALRRRLAFLRAHREAGHESDAQVYPSS